MSDCVQAFEAVKQGSTLETSQITESIRHSFCESSPLIRTRTDYSVKHGRISLMITCRWSAKHPANDLANLVCTTFAFFKGAFTMRGPSKTLPKCAKHKNGKAQDVTLLVGPEITFPNSLEVACLLPSSSECVLVIFDLIGNYFSRYCLSYKTSRCSGFGLDPPLVAFHDVTQPHQSSCLTDFVELHVLEDISFKCADYFPRFSVYHPAL